MPKSIPSVHVNAVREFSENMTSSVKFEERVSQEILDTKGVRHVCCIATSLFKIYLEGVLDM